VAVALQRVDGAVGEHALHAGGDRRRAAVQTLEEFDVGGRDDLGVTAVTDDTDRAVDEVQLVEHLHEQAPRDRVTAAGAEMVFGALEPVGRERRDLARAQEVDGGSLGHRTAPSVAARILARMMSTSRRSPWRIPDSSWLTPPIECTGTAPFTASRTSSTICPALSSYTST